MFKNANKRKGFKRIFSEKSRAKYEEFLKSISNFWEEGT
jgi:hypothetical protein